MLTATEFEEVKGKTVLLDKLNEKKIKEFALNKPIVLDFNISMFNIKTNDIKILITEKRYLKPKNIIELSYLIIKDKKIYFIQKDFIKDSINYNGDVLEEDEKMVDKTINVESILKLCNDNTIVCGDIYNNFNTDNHKDSVCLIDNPVSEKLYTAFMDECVNKRSSLIVIDKNNEVCSRSQPDFELLYCTVKNRGFVIDNNK